MQLAEHGTLVKEGDIDRGQGLILIPSPKEREPKLVWLLEEDAALLSQFPQGLPHLFFFRHGEKILSNSVKPGQKFALTMLYRWWKRACKALEIDGVDLYGGTRHSTVMALRNVASPEAIRRLSGRATNQAVERHYQKSAGETRDIAGRLRADNVGGNADNALITR